MIDIERIYNLVDKECDLSIEAIDKITELKQENSKLKQRVAELEKPKKKRKFRAMTYGEFCEKWLKQYYCCADGIHETLKNVCPFYGLSKATLCDYNEVYTQEPCKLPNGKYILIDVKE